MNIENAKIWSAALRSGEYAQCRNKMAHDGRFCCLGVAHDVLIGPVMEGDRGNYEAVISVLGITEVAETEYVTMNDDDCKSFLQIADYIDSQISAES